LVATKSSCLFSRQPGAEDISVDLRASAIRSLGHVRLKAY